MEKEGWKTIAIVMVALWILTMVGVIMLGSYGMELVKAEEDCSAVCYMNDNAYSYFYDDYSDVCYCYDMKDDVVSTQFDFSESN